MYLQPCLTLDGLKTWSNTYATFLHTFSFFLSFFLSCWKLQFGYAAIHSQSFVPPILAHPQLIAINQTLTRQGIVVTCRNLVLPHKCQMLSACGYSSVCIGNTHTHISMLYLVEHTHNWTRYVIIDVPKQSPKIFEILSLNCIFHLFDPQTIHVIELKVQFLLSMCNSFQMEQ